MNVQKGALSAEYGASPVGVAEFEAFLKENPQVQYIDCVFSDLCGVVRGKRIARGELENVFRFGLKIPSTIYFLDARGDIVAPQGAFDSVADAVAWPVPRTLTRVNWSQRPHGQVLMTLLDAKGEPYFGEPRNVLQRIVDRFAGLELTPVVALELQFYLLDREGTKSIGSPQLNISESAMLLDEKSDRHRELLEAVAEAAAIQSISASVAASNAAPAQFKINLAPIADPARAADSAVFLRQAIRTVARQRGHDATFMAKPYLGLAGDGMHLRISLEHASGKNVFDDGSAKGSELMLWAIGGMQAVMAESIALFAPSVNSYRRFQSGSPVARNKRWGYDNLSAGIRVAGAPGRARHIEHRVAGADANPYLAFAAVLAGIHHGITHQIDPGPAFDGDATGFIDETMPFIIDAALLALENGSAMREYLGRTYVDLYCAAKRIELERFRNVIPPHEYDWYL